ncbi:MAG: C1 family peptidase [Saprospiraceae bacterium]|nr:C1 family peptidase [Saprospiraceae bacterium]
MKKLLLSLLCAAIALVAFAQTEPYDFKEYKRLKATPVKNQDQTGTCWAFSTLSFLESEALRVGKKDVDLSEMYVVRHIYRQKCENYVRRQGTAQFSEGGLAHDVITAVAQFGIMPESMYPGRKDTKAPFNHSKLVKTLKKQCDEYVKLGKEGKLNADWLKEIDQVLDEEFGKVPTKFDYSNVVFTPTSYRDYLGLKTDDYVTVTSFTHHPFWEKFILEVEDNWANGEMYNVPVSDLMRCVKNAIEQGYTVEWDADVSNEGFSAQNGLAIVPTTPWKDKDGIAQANTFKLWEAEPKVTQELRQQLFDRQITTDDHLMHIVGMLDERHSGIYYVVKNSWGEISDNKGYVNCSEAYMRQNTISFTVHKETIPEDIRRRLGLSPGEVNIEKTQGGGKNGRTPEMELQPIPNTRPPRLTPAQKLVKPTQSAPSKKAPGTSDQ